MPRCTSDLQPQLVVSLTFQTKDKGNEMQGYEEPDTSIPMRRDFGVVPVAISL